MKSIDYIIQTFNFPGERPRVHLCLGHFSVKDGIPLITAECVSEREIDAEAEQVIRAVKDARNRAKRAFRRAFKQEEIKCDYIV